VIEGPLNCLRKAVPWRSLHDFTVFRERPRCLPSYRTASGVNHHSSKSQQTIDTVSIDIARQWESSSHLSKRLQPLPKLVP